ncbi:MAG TPA: GNAT family N-acyltransferase [Candidatus Limnocylindrales bacterium]|jgi:putative hemolysin|nr:GNAT family N-acyltransferase [Candidatus Limnocylindrales bacterium]
MRIGWAIKEQRSGETGHRKRSFAPDVLTNPFLPAFLWARGALAQKFPPFQRLASTRQLFSPPYRACLANTKEERKAAFRLRFEVFNIELKEGLAAAFQTGEDTDRYDRYCDHIIVTDERTGRTVGTYRLQTGTAAARHIGYYSEQEFDFAPYRILRDELVELGRACIHPDHRGYEVLMLLWKSITHYAADRKARYMIGCSSLSSQDPAEGRGVYSRLKPALVTEALQTSPTPAYSLPPCEIQVDARPPKLLRTYLALGAKICGPPAFDREFKTIDFLTLMDLNNLTPSIRARLFDS